MGPALIGANGGGSRRGSHSEVEPSMQPHHRMPLSSSGRATGTGDMESYRSEYAAFALMSDRKGSSALCRDGTVHNYWRTRPSACRGHAELYIALFILAIASLLWTSATLPLQCVQLVLTSKSWTSGRPGGQKRTACKAYKAPSPFCTPVR